MFKFHKLTAIASVATLALGVTIAGASMLNVNADSGTPANNICIKAKNVVHGQVGTAGNCSDLKGEATDKVESLDKTNFSLNNQLTVQVNTMSFGKVTWADGKNYYFDSKTASYPNGYPTEFIMTNATPPYPEFACSPELDTCLFKVTYYEDGNLIATDVDETVLNNGSSFSTNMPVYEPNTYEHYTDLSYEGIMSDAEVDRVMADAKLISGQVTAEIEFVAVEKGVERTFGTLEVALEKERVRHYDYLDPAGEGFARNVHHRNIYSLSY